MALEAALAEVIGIAVRKVVRGEGGASSFASFRCSADTAALRNRRETVPQALVPPRHRI
jgi:hypothetical protein